MNSEESILAEASAIRLTPDLEKLQQLMRLSDPVAFKLLVLNYRIGVNIGRLEQARAEQFAEGNVSESEDTSELENLREKKNICLIVLSKALDRQENGLSRKLSFLARLLTH